MLTRTNACIKYYYSVDDVMMMAVNHGIFINFIMNITIKIPISSNVGEEV